MIRNGVQWTCERPQMRLRRRCARWRPKLPLVLALLSALAAGVTAISEAAGTALAAGAETLIASGGTTYAPFHYTVDGEPTGFDVDLIRAVARTAGLDIKVELAPWSEARAAMDSGLVQIHVGMTISRDREQTYHFASPHLSQHYRIFVRRGTPGIHCEADLAGKRLIVQSLGVMARYVVDKGYTAEPLTAANAEEALRMLAAGEGDACLMSELRGLHVISETGLTGISRVGEPVYQTFHSFAVTPGRADLVPRLNQGLAILKASGEYDRIYDRWFGVLERDRLSTWDVVAYAGWVVLPLLFAFLLATLWSWTLRRQVMRQTVELRRTSDLAEAASLAKSQFLANMSHEIRTPLNGVLGMSQILMSTALDAEQKDHVETIRKSGEALQAIITDILDFSRIEAGARTLESISFRPAMLFSDALDIVRLAAAGKGLELRVTGLAELPSNLTGDPTVLRQVLLNLLNNAVKFTADGFVELAVQATAAGPDHTALEIAVIDTGIGVPADRRAGLFDAFTQADPSTTRRFGGTGLGLAICRELVGLMGGDIHYEPRNGGGSVFRVQILMTGACTPPMSDLPDEPASEPATLAAPAAPRDLGEISILLVEDNDLNQRVMALLMKRYGLDMTLARNGQEALDICAGRRFDIILMDCQMPVMDGFVATATLRAREAGGPHTPIIALTAGAFATDREKCLSAGMDDFLTKPVDAGLLLETICTWTGSGAPTDPIDLIAAV